MKSSKEAIIDFWNSSLGGYEPSRVEGRWIKNKAFNDTLKKYFSSSQKILDFACGSGWLSFEMAFMFKDKKIIGIDSSSNLVDYAYKCLELSSFLNSKFIKSSSYLVNSKRRQVS